MKKMLIAVAALAAHNAFAAPTCNAPEERWMNPVYFETELEAQGYKVDSVKVSAGNCYEVSGTDKNGKKVELYFNPETAEVVGSK